MGGLLAITAVATFDTFFCDRRQRRGSTCSSLASSGSACGRRSCPSGSASGSRRSAPGRGSSLLAFFTFSVILYAFKHGVHAPGVSEFSPTYTLFIALVPVLFFNFVGFELPNAAGDEMRTRRRTCRSPCCGRRSRRSCSTACRSWPSSWSSRRTQITGLGGFIDAMKTVFTVYGGRSRRRRRRSPAPAVARQHQRRGSSSCCSPAARPG